MRRRSLLGFCAQGLRKVCGVRGLTIAWFAIVCSMPTPTQAQTTSTFTGGNASLTLSSNWTGNTTPAAGDSWWIATTSTSTLTYDFDSATFPSFWTNGITFGPLTGVTTISGGASTTMTLGGNILNLSASAATISANIALTSSLTVASAAAGNIAITGVISENTAGLGLTKQGIGTLTLSNANLYTGTTAVNSGALALAFSSTTLSNIVNSASALSLRAGTLQIVSTGVAGSQQFNGVTYGGGSATISYTAGTSFTLTLGSLTSTGGGTLNFNNLAGASYTVTTSNANLATGILGGGIFAGNNDFATNNGTKVTTFTGYTTQNVVTSWTSATTIYQNGAALTGAITTPQAAGGIKFAFNGATGISFNGGILTLDDGAGVGTILIGSTVAARALTISTSVGTTGTSKLTAGGAAGGELVFLNNGGTTTNMTVGVGIGDNESGGVVDVMADSTAGRRRPASATTNLAASSTWFWPAAPPREPSPSRATTRSPAGCISTAARWSFSPTPVWAPPPAACRSAATPFCRSTPTRRRSIPAAPSTSTRAGRPPSTPAPTRPSMA
jgi:autotransporter-associated beta strand protein